MIGVFFSAVCLKETAVGSVGSPACERSESSIFFLLTFKSGWEIRFLFCSEHVPFYITHYMHAFVEVILVYLCFALRLQISISCAPQVICKGSIYPFGTFVPYVYLTPGFVSEIDISLITYKLFNK